MFKVNEKPNRSIPLTPLILDNFTHFSGVSIFDFEQLNTTWVGVDFASVISIFQDRVIGQKCSFFDDFPVSANDTLKGMMLEFI